VRTAPDGGPFVFLPTSRHRVPSGSANASASRIGAGDLGIVLCGALAGALELRLGKISLVRSAPQHPEVFGGIFPALINEIQVDSKAKMGRVQRRLSLTYKASGAGTTDWDWAALSHHVRGIDNCASVRSDNFVKRRYGRAEIVRVFMTTGHASTFGATNRISCVASRHYCIGQSGVLDVKLDRRVTVLDDEQPHNDSQGRTVCHNQRAVREVDLLAGSFVGLPHPSDLHHDGEKGEESNESRDKLVVYVEPSRQRVRVEAHPHTKNDKAESDEPASEFDDGTLLFGFVVVVGIALVLLGRKKRP
jgi:hypothetical protein